MGLGVRWIVYVAEGINSIESEFRINASIPASRMYVRVSDPLT